jgi:hypothetical protein
VQRYSLFARSGFPDVTNTFLFASRRGGVFILRRDFLSKENRRIGVLFYGGIISPYLLNSLDQKLLSLALTAGGERWLQTRRKVVPFRQKGGWFLAESDTDTQM